ncbi:hypothetical protein [Allomuricauda sp. M10]|uniref:hypothetical protein n=1 Tax=Allomuricauda sp. M10 TaxID=2683292 RepID=UPI001D192259|nr:hypothetical protein [Muricauda sp. M10]
MKLSFFSYGQEPVTKSNVDIPLLENIHLQLNKTAFFNGEHLWFQAYVQDGLQELPSSTTTNLHVGIFSEDGKMIAKKMFLVDNGISSGDFKIDSTFVKDSYTLMAWTNYMKNFEASTPFVQNITLIGNEKPTPEIKKEGITILIHPEGQHIIADAYNNVGLMIYDEARNPVKTDGIQLVTEEGTEIQSNIQTNELGQGRFGFIADANASYFLKIKDVNGQWITKKLESKLQEGFGISVDNMAEDVVVLSPKWSDHALDSINGSKITMAIFNLNNVPFIHQYELDRDKNAISVNRNQIPIGINTAVILDEKMKPLSQRMFFNKRSTSTMVHSVEVSYCLTKNQDSLQLDLILPEGMTMANLSMSVLPAESSAYLPNNSIGSSFLVQPYLKQQFVDGNYFFEGTKRSKDFQLDTRLLMEGTDKLNWNIRGDNIQNPLFELENNIAIKGKILDADTSIEMQVSLMSQSFGTVNLFDLSSDKSFQGNLPVFEGDSILISVLSNKGKLRMPKAELYFNNDQDSYDYNNWLSIVNKVGKQPVQLDTDENMALTDRTISLDEVVVSEKAKEIKKYQITANTEIRIIDEAALKRYTFESYIRMLGFRILPNYVKGEGGINIYISNPPGLQQVPVFIDGMSSSPGDLISRPLSSIKSVVYNKSRPTPFISMYLRNNYDRLYGRGGKFLSLKIPNGFSRTQDYFTPNYPDYSSFLYKKYGAIWWESLLGVNSEVPYSIIVPLNDQKEVKVIVEGMSADGHLYHTELICSPFDYKYSAH